MAEHGEGCFGRQERPDAERQIEGDHVAVEQAKSVLEIHGARSNHRSLGPRRRHEIPRTRGRETVEGGRINPP